jgi:nucleotide-binding universal stress UspA family protein
MFHKILVCSEGSADSLCAARIGASLAAHFGSEVLALNVFHMGYAELGVWEMAIDQNTIDGFAGEQQEANEQSLEPIFKQRNITFRMKQERGRPVDSILHVAETEKVDLIVMGSRGLGGFKEFLLGSVSSGVLHHASCPVLIARADPTQGDTGEFRHILLASDGSQCAQNAASFAVDIADRFATSLSVLNVCADISALRLPGDSYVPLVEGDADLYARRLLEKVTQDVGSLAKEKGVSCSYHQEMGHTDEIIVRFAERSNADLLVLGSRGLGGFERMLLGSVSHHVAHHANCSVLIVR